jgi:1,4-dihydroxy-2-naphthoate polyprenyltransferase
MPLKMNFVRQKGQHPGIMSIWVQALRLHFVPTSILPALLGSIIARSRFREFNFWYFPLVIVGVTVHHVGLNMIDDVFDYLHAVDRSHGEKKNP